MIVLYCDCCKRKISEAENVYSVEIRRGNDRENALNEVCIDCYGRFKEIIDNAEQWRNKQAL